MFGLTIADIVVILLYFVVVLIIGIRAMKNVRTQEDYFLGGRRFGKLVQIFSAFGQATSADSAVGTTTTTYQNGASGIWSALLFLWGTPIYWLTSPWYRRLRVLTLGDFFEERFGSKRMAAFYAIIASMFLMSFISIGLKAVTYTVQGITQKQSADFTPAEQDEYTRALELDQLRQAKANATLGEEQHQRLELLEAQKPHREFSYVNQTTLVWLICAVVFLYAVTGGLEAAMYTDLLQGIFIIVLSIILIPFGLAKVNTQFGGEGLWDSLATIHHQLPDWYFDIFGSASTIDFTWYYIASISVLIAVNVAVQANQLNTIGAAKDELTARIGFTTGSFLKRFCTVLWGVTGLIAIVLYSGKINNPDFVWGHATRDLLGGVGFGLVGLMIACLLAALMSSADMMMITASGVLTRNVCGYLLPDLDERKYVLLGRVSGGIVLIGAALLACWFDSILQLLKFIWEFNAILAAAFWCGMKWRRCNRTGAWSSMIVAMLTFAALPTILGSMSAVRESGYLLKQTNPEAVKRTYSAGQWEVQQRQQEIEAWDKDNAQGLAKGDRPVLLNVDDTIIKMIQPPRKSVFWSKGVGEVDGSIQGQGMLYVDMVVVDKFTDLSKLPYAMVETIRTIIRLVLPFSVIIIVSLLTRPDDKNRLDRFYSKMRTPVLVDRGEDKRQLDKSLADPNRYREKLLFPNSQFELFKWDRVDTIGFALSVIAVLAIIGMLQFLLNIGS
jgi:SSS family solute:Na+ symporter